MTLHTDGKPSYIRGQGPSPVFDDTQRYWYATAPEAGVKVPATGFTAEVLSEDGTSMRVRLN